MNMKQPNNRLKTTQWYTSIWYPYHEPWLHYTDATPANGWNFKEELVKTAKQK
jgi:hypothetical protein